MNTIKTEYLEERFNELLSAQPESKLKSWQKEGFQTFTKVGLPTLKNEEWKYTGISRLFTRDFSIPSKGTESISRDC